MMLWYRRHWQENAFLTLFFFKLKQANNGAQLEAQQEHKQFILAAAGSDAAYNATTLLLNLDKAPQIKINALN